MIPTDYTCSGDSGDPGIPYTRDQIMLMTNRGGTGVTTALMKQVDI